MAENKKFEIVTGRFIPLGCFSVVPSACAPIIINKIKVEKFFLGVKFNRLNISQESTEYRLLSTQNETR